MPAGLGEFAAPTSKSALADEEGRGRTVARVLSARAAYARPAWVAAGSPPGVRAALSPAAREHRQRAARLSPGFHAQLRKELALGQARVEAHLSALEAGCQAMLRAHSPGPAPRQPPGGGAAGPGPGAEGTPMRTTPTPSSTGRKAGGAASPLTPAAAAPAAGTPRLYGTPPTVARPAAATTQPPASTTSPGEAGWRQHAPWTAQAPPATPLAAPYAAAGAAGAAASPGDAALGGGRGPGATRARRQLAFSPPSAQRFGAAETGLGARVAQSAAPGAPLPAAFLGVGSPEQLRGALQGGGWGSSAVGGAAAVRPGGPQAGPRRAEAWAEPASLLPHGSLHKFLGGLVPRPYLHLVGDAGLETAGPEGPPSLQSEL
ncbi:hypothetical protein TSOC_001210 [Tetrabaena socialis]|uniref:Uncharacterized protein n=1 Tax=Tetrabaena socialis TaxID=47790 RepID=A0A2J8AH94_9CHLO|nr:hypothetical protein TSOC_001210 [Tetrabaena socialis]|eukprot:PNH11893.1 hypothetical protein TSOC_001210 [Tetrabaena socialis]